MPKLRPAKPDEVTRVLERLGFTRIRKAEAMLMEDGRRYQCIKAENWARVS